MKTKKVELNEHTRISGSEARGKRLVQTVADAALDSGGEDYDSGYEGSERYCYACGGRGWMVTCIDDLCHGQDECIHGDPPTPCRECNPKGEREDCC